MIELSSIILPILLSTKIVKSSRAEYVLNLGITDQKVHQHKRTSITEKQGLTLISTWSKTIQLNNEALTYLGEILLFVIRNMIATTTMSNIFNPIHEVEK